MALDASRTICESQGAGDEDVWKKNPRASTGALQPLPFQGKPALKTLEAELQRQVNHSHQQLQRDLDLLHEQVHAEVHAAITKELHGVARKIAEILKNVESLRHELRRETEPVSGRVQHLSEEVSRLRMRQELDANQAHEAAQHASSAASAEVSEKLQSEAFALRGEMANLKEQLAQELVARLQQVQGAQQEAEEAQRQSMQRTEQSLEALGARLDHRLEELAEEVTGEVQAESMERTRLQGKVEGEITQARRARDELEEALRAQAAVGAARFQESQAAVAGLEQRLTAAMRTALDAQAELSDGAQHRAAAEFGADVTDVAERLSSLASDVKDRLICLDTQLQDLKADCAEGLEFAHASCARMLDWKAEVDLQRLESEGKLNLVSPTFTAAGLKNLQLHLRLHSSGGRHGREQGEESKPPRWACGAFLRASAGQISFRLHINGRSQMFAGDFEETPEWGSPRIAVLEHAEPVVSVRLEILDATAPVHLGEGWPSTLSATLLVADAARAAKGEAALLRSALARRVEWRIARASERLAAARTAAAGGDGTSEPLCSPAFAAAGLEGLQLQLYPLGYRTRSDETCGFFLVCPRGVYVKCRAFVGDASRTFDYQYESREPYGRGSFCRLADKIGDDDSITCGVEFLEVRQEQSSEVRGGPFGNVVDQMKIVSSPANGGMEVVRELREIQNGMRESLPGRHSKGLRQRPTGTVERMVPLVTKGSPLIGSKSMPVLLPAVSGTGTNMGLGAYAAATPPNRRQAGVTLMH
mmetsp:Transcript_53493/g.148284  ORF Transcript_53493/g.148284 Transcript_53493/m.148284 type:complete len:763 (-) Transcript_53493:107-2395(-)